MIKEEPKPTIGVGPYQGSTLVGEDYDSELLAEGDRRNVADQYRYLTNEAIKKRLDLSRCPLQIAIENWQHDFNIGSIVRTANAFNLEKVHIVGKKHWNRRGAMVTDKYLDIEHHQTTESFVEFCQQAKRQIVVIDNVPGAKQLSKVTLPKKAVLVFGGEGPGVSQELQQASNLIVEIEQFGSTRSINVGAAASIAMYVWLQQHFL